MGSTALCLPPRRGGRPREDEHRFLESHFALPLSVTLLTAEIQVERTTHTHCFQERLEGRGRRRIAPRPPATPEEMPGRKPTPHPAQRHGPAGLDLWFAARRGGGRCRIAKSPRTWKSAQPNSCFACL